MHGMKQPDLTISSLSNPLVRQVRALEQKKHRDEDGLFVVEGLRYVTQALLAGWVPAIILVTPRLRNDTALLKLLAPHNARRAEITPALMSRLTGRDNPEDVICAFRQRLVPVAEATTGLWVALEEIRDPGNLGTIIRTAEAAGASGVVLIGNCCDVWSAETVRASVGAISRVRIVRQTQADFVKWAGSYKGRIIGTQMAAATDFRKSAYKLPTLLLMGSEHAGLSAAVAAACTDLVNIPMQGEIESLNVATATALVLYEINRQVM